MHRQFFYISVLTLTLFITVNPSLAVTHTLSGSMDAAQATTNPDDTGNGSGTILGDYDAASNTLNYSLEWMDLTTDVTNMHFHVGALGVQGGVDLGVPAPWASPQIGSDILLTDDQETNLLSGNWYLNIHTTDFGGGEIRGQVIVNQVPEPTSAGLTTCAFLTILSLFRRRRNLY